MRATNCHSLKTADMNRPAGNSVYTLASFSTKRFGLAMLFFGAFLLGCACLLGL